MPSEPNRSSPFSFIAVALAAWIIPGAGYLLIGQRTRGLTIGITILALFFFGLLIGGVRCLEVPGYDAHGNKMYSYIRTERSKDDVNRRVRHVGKNPGEGPDTYDEGWTLASHPLDEIRSKPWSIAQIMMGPIDVLCDWWSVRLGQPSDPTDPNSERLGARSHSRVNELGVLFTAVAGMLNLLAIIDSSHRGSHAEAK